MDLTAVNARELSSMTHGNLTRGANIAGRKPDCGGGGGGGGGGG